MAKKGFDRILFFCTGLLLILGSLMLFSISATLSQETFGKTYFFLVHQILYGILPGIILGFVAFRMKLSDFKRFSLPLFLANLVFLFLVFVPKMGLLSGGARRWLKLGPISFQPSELLKISLFVYLAAWLERRWGEKRYEKSLQKSISFLTILGPICLALVLQPDIGTLLLIMAVAFLMYFFAETRFFHIILAGLLTICILLLMIIYEPYRMNRILVFLIPQLEPMGIGYQAKQAQIAIGSGGLFGKGIGMSKQKFFLSSPLADSIFALLCEETGFLGALILIVLFTTFLIRGFKIANMAKDKFSKLLAFGICLEIILQALLNIGSMTGTLPLTGVPLPFISYGGTHIISELIGVGILLNISKSYV